MHKQVLIKPVQTQAFQEALRSPCDRTSVAIRCAFLNQRRAHAYSVARMARPTGITTNAGPGNTNSATPISRTVAPTTETITRLMILTLSRFGVRKSRLTQRKVCVAVSLEGAVSSHRPPQVNWIGCDAVHARGRLSLRKGEGRVRVH